MDYKDPIQQAAEALQREARKPRSERMTRDEIAQKAGVGVAWLYVLQRGETPNASYKRIQSVLRVLAEGRGDNT